MQIRSETSALLTVKEEFREITTHCQKVFGQGALPQPRVLQEPIVLSVDEVQLSIQQLQARNSERGSPVQLSHNCLEGVLWLAG